MFRRTLFRRTLFRRTLFRRIPGPRRGKLRTQVLVGVLSITLGALALFDVAAVTSLRTYLINQTDNTLKSVLTLTQPRLAELLPAHRKPGQQPAPPMPVIGEYYIAFVPAKGALVSLQGVPGLAPPGRASMWRAAENAQVHAKTAAKTQRMTAAKTGPKTVTVVGSAPFSRYRLGAISVPAFSGTLVDGADLKGVDATVDRLKMIVAAGSAAAAVAIFLGVGLVMRLGLRPIETMASQADRITAGDLTDRVDPADGDSEVGRLGAALNGMLGRIEASVTEREASQDLMRRFFAEASHELRTPLASLRANAELYEQGALTGPAQVDEAMRRIRLEAQRMSRLVDDMLRLARLDQHPARQCDPVDLTAVARDCVERARVADPARTWRADIGPGLVAVGDQEMLCRAVDNLLANVRAHTPEGTVATVTAGQDGDGNLVVQVSDDGPGVPAGQLPRIFDRFYRAGGPAQRSGSGLGLAIVTEIAAAHGGTAVAALNYPRGLRVTVTLPAFGAAELGAAGLGAAGLAQPASTRTTSI